MANYKESIVDIELTKGHIHRSFYPHALGAGDENADRFGVRLFRNGQPENITGNCFGLFVRPDGETVPIESGVVSGNTAYIVLPDDCYVVEGVYSLAIKVSGGGVTGTMRIVDGIVSRTSTDVIVDPGTILPSIEYLIQAIEDAVQSVPPDYSELIKGVKVATGLKALTLEFSAGYIAQNTMEKVRTSTGNHVISEPVKIPAMSLLYVPKVSKSRSVALLCECEGDGTPLFVTLRGSSTNNSTGEYVIVPVINESYFIFGGNTTMEDYMQYYVKEFTEDMVWDKDNFPCSDPVAIEYGNGPIISTGTQAGDSYRHSNTILLMKGMTIELWDGGSSANVALSEWKNADYSMLASLMTSNGGTSHRQYTADRSMYVRISARIYPQEGMSVVLPPEYFFSWKIYYKPLHEKWAEKSPLYHKKLTVMGDSLIHGDSLGNGATWITNLGIRYGMTYTNLGINGNSVAEQTAETSDAAMVNRISSVPTDTEIFVLLGGANDKRLNVPIGSIDSQDKTTFIGALNTIVAAVRTRCPKAKIILMTTYNRYESRNNQGFGDEDYANAMIEAGKHNLVPVFDNFHCSGVNFLDESMLTWMDECNNRQILVDGETEYDNPTHHFSIEGYEWLTPMYETLLTAATATPAEVKKNNDDLEYIEAILEAETATAVTSSNTYVEPHGKYAVVNGIVYFKILFKNLQNVNSGTGAVPVANLPIPSGEAVFYETGRGKFTIGSRLEYDNLWKLYGKRIAGEYTLVYGSYTPAT